MAFYFGDFKKIRLAPRVNTWRHDERVIAEVLRAGTAKDERICAIKSGLAEEVGPPRAVSDHLRYRAEGARALDMARMAFKNPRKWAQILARQCRRHAKGCYTAAARIVLFRRASMAGQETPSVRGPGPCGLRDDGTFPWSEL